MIRIHLLLILLCFTLNAPIAKAQQLSFAHYKTLNDAELRLAEYKDNDDQLRIKLQHLEAVNASRRKHKVQEVQLDIIACRVANQIAVEAAQHGYMGHFNLAGEKPYLRYANAGGWHHISENASALSSSGTLKNTDAAILEYMAAGHNAFMAERKPNDGHKQNCIDPRHTHVGLGYAINKGEFRYYEHFLDVYLDVKPFQQTIAAGETTTITFKPTNKLHTYLVAVFYEPHPKAMNAKKISSIHKYDDFSETTFMQLPPWELPQPDADGWTTITMTPDKKGTYYFHIYLSEEPFTKGEASTKGKIQASGIVVFVR